MQELNKWWQGMCVATSHQSYTSDSTANGGTSHARQVVGEKPDKEVTHCSSSIAGGLAPTTLPHET